MRRALVVAAAALALVGAACGGGDDDKTNASNDSDSSGNDNAAAIAAGTLTGVCGGREAVAIGAAGASAQQSGSVDYNAALEGLRRARDAAPSEIKDDFSVLVEAQTPFFQALAKANGNYMSAVQDPAFQAAAQRMGEEDVQEASQNISDWFESHCD